MEGKKGKKYIKGYLEAEPCIKKTKNKSNCTYPRGLNISLYYIRQSIT